MILIIQIYTIAIEYQFREIITVEETVFPEEDEVAELNETQVDLIDFSRPSDYRLMAVVAKKEGYSASDGDDTHLEPSLSQTSIPSHTSEAIDKGENGV